MTTNNASTEVVDAFLQSIGTGEFAPLRPISVPLPDVLPVPESAVPEPIKSYVLDVAKRMSVPPDMVLAGVIVMLSIVVGAGCEIRPKQKDDWAVVPNLWGAIVSPPSKSLKSASFRAALAPLIQLEASAVEEFKKLDKEHQAAEMVHDAQRKNLQDKLKSAVSGSSKVDLIQLQRDLQTNLENEPDKQQLKRYMSSDSTKEKLLGLLKGNPRGILVCRDELAGWIATLGMQKHEADRAFYLESWNGNSPYTEDRIDRGTTSVPNLCFSVFGGIQPDKLRRLFAQALTDNDGLVQRFQVMVYPDQKPWVYCDELPNVGAQERLFEIVSRLSKTDFTEYGAECREGKRPFFRFNEAAQKCFVQFWTQLENEKLQKDAPDIFKEHLQKFRSLIPSLALIFHLVDAAQNNKSGPVGVEAVNAAIDYAEYLESHAWRIYSLVTQRRHQAAAHLADKITAGKLEDGFSVRDVARKEWSFLNDDEDVIRAAIADLMDFGWLAEYKGGPTGKAVAYRINPQVKQLGKPGAVSAAPMAPPAINLFGVKK